MSQSHGASERREIYFSGHVQGVGFRYTARQIASRFDVRGFVKNLGDGRVLLVVEGAPDTLDQFVDAVAGEMDRHVRHRQASVLRATGEFTNFEVRH